MTNNSEDDDTYVRKIFAQADSGDLEALYTKGALFDLGELVPLDKLRASEIFKEAADRGHAHSMWIHACELLWGLGSYPQSVDQGLEYLERAIEHKSGEACITKAKLYFEGELGFPKDRQMVDELREIAKTYDETVYDPYA